MQELETVTSPVALSWEKAELDRSVTRLGEYVERMAEEQIEWYSRKKRWKSRLSRGLRLASLVLFAAGAATPLVQASFPALASVQGIVPGHIGYLLIALAAGCVAFDRFFGLSSGWMRYVTAAFALETALERFRFEWAHRQARRRGASPTAAEVGELVSLCAETALGVRVEVEQETAAWVAEFQSNLARLEQELRQKSKRGER